jgi:transposase
VRLSDIIKIKMSTSPYSKDLRQKVITYIEKGNSQKSASEVFSIHRNTINRWWLRYKESGIILAKPRHGLKSKLDLKDLALFVDNNSDCRLTDIGKKFNITTAWASMLLKKMGYSYKKKRLPIWKRT